MVKNIKIIDEDLGNELIYKNKCQVCNEEFLTNKEEQLICGDCVPQNQVYK